MVFPDLWVNRAIPVLQVHKDLLETMVLMELSVLRVSPVTMVRTVLPELEVRKGCKDLQVRKVIPDKMAMMELPVRKDLPVKVCLLVAHRIRF